MRSFTAFCALAAAALLPPGSAAASATAAAQQRAQQVFEAAFPFAPPLDRPIRFRSEQTKERDGRLSSLSSLYEVTFRQSGDGYTMHVDQLETSLPDDPALPPAIKALMKQMADEILILELSAEGEMLSVQDGDRRWAEMMNAVREMAPSVDADGTPADPGGLKAFNAVLDAFETMPAEARLAMLTKDLQPLVEFADTILSSDEPIETQVEADTPFGAVMQDVSIRLTEADHATGTIVVTAAIPRDELLKMVGNVVETIGDAAGKPIDEKEMEAELEDFSLTDTSTYRVSQQDGLLVSVFHERRSDVSGGDEAKRVRDTLKIERLD